MATLKQAIKVMMTRMQHQQHQVGRRNFVTTNNPLKMKSTTTTTSGSGGGSDHQHRRWVKGEYAPVYVAAGLIVVAGIIGVHTLNQQLMYNPAVNLKKKKRETLTEVDNPDVALGEADKLVNKSFFRKVAHLQEFDNDDNRAISDPIRGDVYTRRPREAETLQSVGVDPRATTTH